MMSIWSQAAAAMVASGVSAAIALLWIDAPYGRFAPDKPSYWGPTIPARWAWFIQESPSVVLMLLYWLVWANLSNASALPNTILAALFSFHYIVRAWIYPWMLNQSKPVPISVMLMALVFCLSNGWMQGSYLFTSPDTRPGGYEKEWLELTRVRVGLAMFVFGWVANQHADYVLRHLRDEPSDKQRKDGASSEGGAGAGKSAGAKGASDNSVTSRYRIPYGGLFRFCSAANYTGEIIEWTGWALAANSWPAWAFAAFTFLNLAPRAISSHRWYKKHFPNYPRDRKAVIPFLL